MNAHRVLIVGVGSIGERHLRCFQNTHRAELSFCEPNDPLRQTIAQRYHIHRSYADLDTALASQPDVAVICTPAHLHVPLATKLAQAGVHLLCEKPLSTTLTGVQQLLEIVQQQKVTAAVAYVYRCNPLSVAFKTALDSGRFGQPVQLVHVSGQHFPLYRPAYREIYYADHAKGGGAIQDSITHMLNLGEWLVGPIDRLAADAAHQQLPGVQVEDTVHVLTRQGSVLGSYSHNQYQAPNEVVFTIVCTKATLRAEYHRQRWLWMGKPSGDWQEVKLKPLERDDSFIAQANMFLDAVENKAPLRCTLAQGLQTLRVNLATLQAAEQQTWQDITSTPCVV